MDIDPSMLLILQYFKNLKKNQQISLSNPFDPQFMGKLPVALKAVKQSLCKQMLQKNKGV